MEQLDNRTTGGWRDGGMTGGRGDSGMTGGWRDGGTMGGSQDNGRQQVKDRSTPARLGATLGTRGCREIERIVLLVKYTRHFIRREEGTREKASIYMILAPTLAPHVTPPTTPPRTPVKLSPTTAELL